MVHNAWRCHAILNRCVRAVGGLCLTGTMIDNRELASLIWLLLLLGFAITKRNVRSSMGGVTRAFLSPKLLIPLVAYMAVLAGLVWLAEQIGLWDVKLLGSTIIWFFFSGFVLFMKTTDAGKAPHFFRDRFLDTVTMVAFFEFFVNIKPFSLPIEMLLVPTITVLAMMQILASYRPEHAVIRRPLQYILGSITLILVMVTVVGLVTDWPVLDKRALLQSFLLPIWLTLGALPLIYVLALVAGYEQVFLRMEILNEHRKPSLASRLGIALGLRGNVTDVSAFGGSHPRAAAEAGSVRGALAAVDSFKRQRAQRKAEETEQRRRLEQYAGVEGVDEDGRRLDQREFEEAKRALQWLATCHMGWYRQRGRYREDLLDVLGDFTSQGLPEKHGITMRVRNDGQAWFAYRRTASRWVFAIGAAKEPPDQWFYDGAEEPKGFPGSDSIWGETAHNTPANW